MTIVLTGGSGFIGSALAKRLLSEKHTVVVVDRHAPAFTHERLYFINCDITYQALPYNILEHTDAVIHLVGSPIARKWNKEVKDDIQKTRVESTKKVVEGIALAQSRPPVFICASAVGFYGDTGEYIADEQSLKGEGFLADVVEEWEEEARKASESGVRVVLIRTAPVLGRGGILASILQTARFGFLIRFTKKNFWMSWIHQEDIVNVYMFALETNTLQGVVNASAPEPIQYQNFMKLVSSIFRRRIIATLPVFVGKMVFGDFFEESKKDERVAPKRLLDKGFVFKYPTLDTALKAIYTHNETNR